MTEREFLISTYQARKEGMMIMASYFRDVMPSSAYDIAFGLHNVIEAAKDIKNDR